MVKVEARRFVTAAKEGSLIDAPASAPKTCATVRALVIGINAYFPATDRTTPGSGPGALDNAVADARAMHAALSALPGAASTLLTDKDCTKAKLEAALRDFRDSTGSCKDRGMKVVATRARAEEVRTLGVIFFAGHGLQLGNANYLVPADWRVPTLNDDVKTMEEDAAEGCIGLTSVENMLSKTSMSAGAVLLDCCRNVPDFWAMMGAKHRVVGGARSLPAGMGAVTPGLRDLMVTFATAPGTVALDRSSRVASHSPFTAALLKALAVPQLRLLDLNPRVTDEVFADSGGKQRPHVGGSYGVEAGNLVLLG